MLDKIKALRPKKSGEGGQYIVGLDIGTEYVKALIAQIKDDQIEIIGVGRVKFDRYQ